MRFIFFILLILLIAQIGFWKTLGAVLGAVLMLILLGALVVALIVIGALMVIARM